MGQYDTPQTEGSGNTEEAGAEMKCHFCVDLLTVIPFQERSQAALCHAMPALGAL